MSDNADQDMSPMDICPHCGAGTGSPGNLLSARGQALIGKLEHFLVGDTDSLPLRVFEVLFTSTFLLWMARCFLTWREWLTGEGFHLTTDELVNMGYPPPFALLDGHGAVVLAMLILVSATGLIINRARRLALAGLFGCSVYVQGVDLMAAFTLNKLFVGVYGVLLLSPGYTIQNGRMVVSNVAVRVIQATLILQYLAAGMAKAFKGDWLKYSDVLHTQLQGVYRTDFAAWLLRVTPVWVWTVMQWITLLFELEAVVLFTVRRLRTVAFIIGMGFHLVIAVCMKDLIYFSAQMWTFYALFLTADEWRVIGGWLKAIGERALIRRGLPGRSSITTQ